MSAANLTNSDSYYNGVSVVRDGLLFISNLLLGTQFLLHTVNTMQSSPITGLDRPRGFHEVKAPRFRDNGTEWW